MSGIKNPLGDKTGTKPAQDAQDIGADHGTDEGSISAIGEKNISDNARGGGDGSVPGEAPNTFLDPRDAEKAEGKIKSAD